METRIDWGFVVTMGIVVAICGEVFYTAYWPKKLEPRKFLPNIASWRLRLPFRRPRVK